MSVTTEQSSIRFYFSFRSPYAWIAAERFPSSRDTDWALSHAAFLGAESQGAGQRFMVQVFRKRFSEGLDVGDDRVVSDAALEADLDPDSILTAGHSGRLPAEASAGWRRAVERDRIFGVPSFVYADRLYWGQDRMHFLRNAVIRKAERTLE